MTEGLMVRSGFLGGQRETIEKGQTMTDEEDDDDDDEDEAGRTYPLDYSTAGKECAKRTQCSNGPVPSANSTPSSTIAAL